MKNHFYYLLIALLAFLLITPILDELGLGEAASLVYVPTFLIAVWSGSVVERIVEHRLCSPLEHTA